MDYSPLFVLTQREIIITDKLCKKQVCDDVDNKYNHFQVIWSIYAAPIYIRILPHP